MELLDLEKSGFHVSSYWTDVLPKKQLEQKLHQAVLRARQRLALSEVKEERKRTR